VDENEFTFATNCPSGHDGLQELYGFGADVVPDHVSVPHDFLDCHRRSTAEEFLPSDVVVFASTMSDSLLAVSDEGAVYYWDYYWQYPRHAAWWQERVNAAVAPFGDTSAIMADPEHPQYQALVDAANYATLSRVADSFAEFAASTFEPDMDAWLADHQPQVVKPKGLRRLFRRR
jgi:hypothetical protein